MGSIYKITNTVNGKSYIGQTIYDAEKTRIRQHLNGHSCGSKLVKHAIERYGKDAFTYEILHDGIIPEFLDTLEKEAIDKFNTVHPHGYNRTSGGGGGPHSEDTCQRISEYVKKRVAEGAHHLLGDSNPSHKRVAEGTHNFLGDNNPNRRRLAEGTHNLQGDNNPMRKPKTRQKIIETLRSPYYTPAYETFCTLQKTLTLHEIRKTLHEQFQNVHKSTINKWLSRWHPEARQNMRGTHRNPYHTQAYEFFCALSKTLTLREIRKTLYEQFPDVPKRTIRSWVKKWHSET